jgi:voltage-gated potassium channel
LAFLKWGWIDLISCIPAVDFLRAGRLLRLIKLFRIIRAFRSVVSFTNHIFANKTQGTFASVSIIAVLLVIFSSIAILHVEVDPKSNIKTAEDALWWAYVTITTVGYGDRFPVTMEGRAIATILMTAGVGLFGIFSGLLASWFVKGNGPIVFTNAQSETE